MAKARKIPRKTSSWRTVKRRAAQTAQAPVHGSDEPHQLFSNAARVSIDVPIPATSVWINDVRGKLEGREGNWIFLMRANSGNYVREASRLLRVLGELGYEGVYVSLNRPHANLLDVLHEEAVDVSKLHFADAVSMQAGGVHESSERVVYVNSPKDLTDLSIAIDAVLPRVKSQKRFLLVDSLSTLLMYHPVESVGRFTHFLASKLRASNVNGALLSPSDHPKNDELHELLLPLCDEVVEMG